VPWCSSPDRLSEREIQRYLVHLNQERGLSHSTCNQVAVALRFFDHVTLRRPATSFVIPAARTPSKLPQVLSPEELLRLFTQPLRPKHRALFLTAYGAGLRVSEGVALRVRIHDHARFLATLERLSIHPVWTPTEASWLNLIEAQFGVLKRFTLMNTDDSEHSHRRSRTYAYLRYRSCRLGTSSDPLMRIRTVRINKLVEHSLRDGQRA
jgi:hypothetical protein